MSHVATAWAASQSNLKPYEKLVLLTLADRHNPDYGCFPSQELIAKDCNMSRRAVQNQIKSLTKRGLIVIHRLRLNASTKFPVNRYYFPFEEGF